MQRRLARFFADALRAFVHAEIGADAMADAVLKIDALGPHELAGQRIQMVPHGAGREGLPGKRQMYLEGEAVIGAADRSPARRSPRPG